MQSRDDIQRAARHEGVPATTIEKDLLLDAMLDEIARAPYGAGTLYFKGGTAIRKLFIPGYRYSEDLDFTFEGSWNIGCAATLAYRRGGCDGTRDWPTQAKSHCERDSQRGRRRST